jgi:hypothetical protein
MPAEVAQLEQKYYEWCLLDLASPRTTTLRPNQVRTCASVTLPGILSPECSEAIAT